MSQPKILEDKEYSHSRKELYMDSTGQYRPRQSKSLGRPQETGRFSTADQRQWHSAASSRLDVSKDGLSTFTTDPAHATKTPITQCYPVITTITPSQPKSEVKIKYHDPNYPTKPVSLSETGEVTLEKDVFINDREEQEKVILIEDDCNRTKIVTPMPKDRTFSNSSHESIDQKQTDKSEIIYKTPEGKIPPKRPVHETFIPPPSSPAFINQSNSKIITKTPSPYIKKDESLQMISQCPPPTQIKHTKTYSVPEGKIVEIPTKIVDEHVKTPSTIHREVYSDQVKGNHSKPIYRSISHSPVSNTDEPTQKTFSKGGQSKICKHKMIHCDQVPRKISQIPTKTIPKIPSQLPSQLPTQVSNHVITQKPKSPSPSTIYKLPHQIPQTIITQAHCQTPPPGSIVTEIPSQTPKLHHIPTKFSYQVPTSVELRPIRSPSPIPTQEVITTRICDKKPSKIYKSPQSFISQEHPIKTTPTQIPKQCGKTTVIDIKNHLDQNNTKQYTYRPITQTPSQVYRPTAPIPTDKSKTTTPVSTKICQTKPPTQVYTSTTPASTKICKPTTPIPTQISKTKDIPIKIINDKQYPFHSETERPISQISQKYEDKNIPITESHYDKIQYYHNKSPVPSQSPHYYTPQTYHKTPITPTEISQHISQQTYRPQSPSYPKQISQLSTTKSSIKEDGKYYTDSYLQQSSKYQPMRVKEYPHESVTQTPISEHPRPPSIHYTKTPSTTPAPIKETFKALPPPSPKITTSHEQQLVPVYGKGTPKYQPAQPAQTTQKKVSKLKSGSIIHEIEEVFDSQVPITTEVKHDEDETKHDIYSKPKTIYTPSKVETKQPKPITYDDYDTLKYPKTHSLTLKKELEQVPLSDVGIRPDSQRQYQRPTPKGNEVIYAPKDDVVHHGKETPTPYYTKEPSTTYYTKEPRPSYYTKEPPTTTTYYRPRSPSARKIIEEEYTRHYKKTETTDKIPEPVISSPEPYYEGGIKGHKGYYTTVKDSPNVNVTTQYKKQSPSRPISRNTITFDDSSDTDHQQKVPSYKSLKQNEKKPGSPERLVDEGTILSMPDGFKIILDTSHFHSNDVKITKYDYTLQLEGKHYEVDKYTNDTITRSFVRKYSIPTDIDMDSIKATVDSKGIMTIVGYYKKNTNQYDDKSMVYKF